MNLEVKYILKIKDQTFDLTRAEAEDILKSLEKELRTIPDSWDYSHPRFWTEPIKCKDWKITTSPTTCDPDEHMTVITCKD